jgi:hypothetical protein
MGLHIVSMTIVTGSENVTIGLVLEVGISHFLAAASGRKESPFQYSGSENVTFLMTNSQVGICHFPGPLIGSEFVIFQHRRAGRNMSPRGISRRVG